MVKSFGLEERVKKMSDLTFCIYTATSILSLSGFVLFIWWWFRMRSASEVFVYVTLLLLFIGVERGFLAVFRHAVVVDYTWAHSLILNEWWALRTIPELVIISLIIVRMARRACRTIRLERRYAKDSDVCEGVALERDD